MTATLLKTAAVLLAQGGSTDDDPLDRFNTIVDITGTVLTSLALLVAGVWAYFKFAKGRTFRPRIKLELGGQWRVIAGRDVLQVHLTITNIGASKVVLVQEGTALIVKKPASSRAAPPAMLSWDDGEVFEIFLEHRWIEPSEVVSDDVLIDLGEGQRVPTLLDVRTIWQRKLFKNIDVSARKFVDVGSTLDGKGGGATATDSASRATRRIRWKKGSVTRMLSPRVG